MGHKLTAIFLGQQKIRPSGGGGWQPGANTLVYFPFKEDLLDHSGNSVTMTQGGSNLSIVNGVAEFDGGYLYRDGTIGVTAYPITVSFWVKYSINTGDRCVITSNIYDVSFVGRNIILNNGLPRLETLPGGNVKGTQPTASVRYYYTAVLRSTGSDLYINNTLVGTTASGLDIADRFSIGTAYWVVGDLGNGLFNGYLSEVIIEDRERTSQEIADYFDQTKGDYGIS